MADITPQMVKDLREMTGAGMGDCKKALVDANGDMKEAIEILRKKRCCFGCQKSHQRSKRRYCYH